MLRLIIPPACVGEEHLRSLKSGAGTWKCGTTDKKNIIIILRALLQLDRYPLM